MFYAYPLTATADNWFHDAIRTILRTVHDCVGAGRTLPSWTMLIPEAHRTTLTRRTGLKDRVVHYSEILATLTPGERDQILLALDEQNRIADLLSCRSECSSLGDLPESIRDSIADLFEFAFRLLTSLEIRDKHYYLIYHAKKHHVCPFCGAEKFDAPGKPREALDHYLCLSRYPFAASNLRNLVPMGNKCNSRYKLAQDILRREGIRRRAIDPYNHGSFSIVLSRSIPFAGLNGELPEWVIDLLPETDETVTWDDVFHIRERLRDNDLNEGFKRWLEEYQAWCKSAHVVPTGRQDLLDALGRYAELQEVIGLSELGFLKAGVFRMMSEHCQAGDQRLMDLLLGLTV